MWDKCKKGGPGPIEGGGVRVDVNHEFNLL